VVIDFEGINNRIEALPVSAGDYRLIGPADGGLLYISDGKLMRYNGADQKTEEIMERVSGPGLPLMVKCLCTARAAIMELQSGPNQKPGTGKLEPRQP
jgi:tricorn protease